MNDDAPVGATRRERLLAYAVHVYTALGLLCGARIAADILLDDYRSAFIWMIIAVLIDATDGTLARRCRVKEVVPHIDGRKLDDIVDYLNYTFLPLLMIGRAGWLPSPGWLWASIPLIASVFAFVHVGAKEEDNGFFLGFPSYWNVFAFYTAVWIRDFGPSVVLAATLALSALCVLPVRFVYPNKAPRWRAFYLWGGVVWLALLSAALWYYPGAPVPRGLLIASVIYPACYAATSMYLDRTLP